MGSNNSILWYLVNAFVEWFLILMLLLNSIFTYLIFTFAHHFRLKMPCLCCSSSALITFTHLLCHHHATLIVSSSIHEKTILEAGTGAGPDQHQHRDDADFVDAAAAAAAGSGGTADSNNSTLLEFDFTEDEYDQKDILHDDDTYGYTVVGGGRDGFTWRSQPLIIDGSTCCLGHAHDSAAAMSQTQDTTMIKHIKINEDESYSIAYTAEGDLVMDLCRNLASAKYFSTASDTVDAIPHIKATREQQADELSHQDAAHGKILALQNIENAGTRIELDEEDQPPEKSIGILTQSCLQYGTIEHVHEMIDQVARSVCVSPPFWTEELVCELVQGTSVPASIDLSSERANKQNGEDVPHALLNSPLPANLEVISKMQVEGYQEQASALPVPLSAEDHLDFCQIDNQGSDQPDKSESYSVQHSVTTSSELIKNEEDKLPDTPSSINGPHNRYSNWFLFEKRESATEETFDGSINSDFECGEGLSNFDKLKTALRVERKALHALYAELEEERNASAVAACQTMAMINRLQEEKASVQMEALQYQRMMEEQSEYDQEALQLLNELVVKREKEKQELEKELEICRKRVIDFETKGRLMMLNRKEESVRRGSSSVSGSNAEDSDGVSIDTNVDMKNMNVYEREEENEINRTPFDDVLNMEESFSHFEEERLSILERFKASEEKIFTLDSENDGFSFDHDYSCIMNGTENGCHDDVKKN